MTKTHLITLIVAILFSAQAKAGGSSPNASNLVTIFDPNIIRCNVQKTRTQPYVAIIELKISDTASRQYVFFENGEGIVKLEDGTSALLSTKETATFFGYSEDTFKRDPFLHIRTIAESWTGVIGLFGITAAVDGLILDLIDQKASLYFNPSWNLNINQFKAWLATIAWAEGGLGGYGAHSQYGGGYNGDAFNHIVVGQNFRFSTGIGPFQLDRYSSENWHLWSTEQKLNPQLAVESAARWHLDNCGSGSTLSNFANNSPWLAVRTPSSYWSVVTGTVWSAHSGGGAALDWPAIKNQLASNATAYPHLPYSKNVVDVGNLTWNIKSAESLMTDSGRQVIFDGNYQTWAVTARQWGGQEVCKYYYTYRTYGSDPTIEIWVWDNNWDTNNKFKYVFARECNGQFPERRLVDSDIAGYPVLNQPAIITLDNPPVVNSFDVTPDSVTLGNSFTISYIVSDDIGLNRVELWRAVDVNGNGKPDWPDDPEGYIDIHYLSDQTSYSDSFSDTPSVVDTYWYGLHVVDNAEQLSFEPDPPGPIQVTVTPAGTTPPICVIELLERDRIDPIDEITVDHWFDIYVGDSTDDIGISEVRFASDESQDGISQGTWTQWYDWEVSTGPYGWDSMNKRMAWAFATSGHKEVWAELKDNEGLTSRCYDNIRVPCVCTSWQDQGCGQGPCFETQMYQTRTCDSPGCAIEARCINHMSCEPGWRPPNAYGRRDNDWTNPENAYSSNDQYAVANSWGSNQDWYNFGFDIPVGSIIEGIEIGIEGTGDGDDYVGKVKCWLHWRGLVLSATETDYIEFPATEDSLHILGGPSDLWGWDFWSPEDIVGQGFGVRLSTGLDWHTARIDSIQARIYYRVCPDVSHDWLGLPCLVNSWLQQCNLGNNYCNCCDMNNDGIIDFADVAIFAQHWLEGL